MKKLLLLVALCLCASVALAQTIEIVHLKNGSRIRGIITEQVPNKHLKIQTSDGNLFVYTFDEVEKITKELPGQEPVSAFGNRRNNAYASSFRPHYEGGVDFGYSIGVGKADEAAGGMGRASFSTTHGCRLIPELYVGAGLGVDCYHGWDTYGMPIFADFRGNFARLAVKPFLNFRIGYSVDSIVKGLYFSPSIGINYKMLDVSFGYTYQKANDFYYIYHGDIEKVNFGAITIKVGVRF